MIDLCGVFTSVMAEKMWDPKLSADVLISEFLEGYYGAAAPFVRLYMDTMHAAVDETRHMLRACCLAPPAGIKKSFLTPMALLESATAFKDGMAALKPAETALTKRVERASMAISYVFLFRWAELKDFAANIGYSWPLANDQQAAFDSFARIFNATGTHMLTGGSGTGEAALLWLHNCSFGICKSGAGGAKADYAEIVLDECTHLASTPSDCQLAALWSAVPAEPNPLEPNGTLFKSALSTKKECATAAQFALDRGSAFS